MIVDDAPAIPEIWADNALLEGSKVKGVLDPWNDDWNLVVQLAELGSRQAATLSLRGPATAGPRQELSPTWAATSSAAFSGSSCCCSSSAR